MAKKWTSAENTTAFESDAALRSQNAASNRGRGGRRYAPWVFTEYGVVMAATALDSERAIEVSKFVIDVFIGVKRSLDGQKTTLSVKSWFTDFDPVLDNAILAGNPVPDEFAERAKVHRAILNQNQNQNQNDECSVMSDELNGSSTQNSSLKTHNLRSERHLFPDSFEFTEELGWIPEGWEVKKIGQMLRSVSDTYPLKTVDEIIFLNTGDILDGKFLHADFSATAGFPGKRRNRFRNTTFFIARFAPETDVLPMYFSMEHNMRSPRN